MNNADFFVGNRTALMKALPGAVIVVTNYTRLQRNNDNTFKFESESNFWYLCGIDEPDTTLIIDGSSGHTWLVLPKVEDIHEIFDGLIAPEKAKRVSGVNTVVSADEADSLLRQLARKHTVVYTVGKPLHSEHFNFALNPAIHAHWQRLDRIFADVRDCIKDIAKLRAIKQPIEMRLLQKSIDITCDAFSHVHEKMQSYKYEYEIEADFSRDFRIQGAIGHAFDPVIASGANACTIHYLANDQKIAPRSLVIMDTGARYGGYSADIARTYIKGTPTARQRAVHQEVEAAQVDIIALLRPGLDVTEYHAAVEVRMRAAIKNLKLPGADNEAALRTYFPHAISHGLGIDPHDSLGGPKTLAPGMVLMVEPGIYIPSEKIGVRLEDAIAITDKGIKHMSKKLPTGL